MPAMPLELLADADLTERNTLALPARARLLATLRTTEDVQALLTDPNLRTLRSEHRFILGGGSNLVLGSYFDGLVIAPAIAGRRLAGEDAGAWYVEAGAGETWHDFVQWTLVQGWPGLENLSLIPGTVGAAPIQNIGAYGLEVAERLAFVDAIDLDRGEARRFTADDCRFGYRDSIFKQEGWHLSGHFLITGVTFRLPKQWEALTRYADLGKELVAKTSTPSASDIAQAIIDIRQRKLPDPAQIPNAGSFFQNPVVDAAQAAQLLAAHPGLPNYPQADSRVKLAAGWLIEQAGWKGRNLGPVGMYEKQALVLVNHGGASGADVAALARAVQADVQRQFGVHLLPEPIYLGIA
jgi:UDP-N-acetylmuramate dehydrogenase